MSVEIILDKIADKLKNRHLFAIFDRDGTLVPINPDPSAAILQEHIRKLLLDLNSLPNTQVAILSARDLKELGNDFQKGELILAGNYGMEQLIPNKELWIQPNAIKSRKLLLEVKGELEKSLSKQTQVILEDHQLVLCLHWHLTPPEHIAAVHNCISILKEKYSGLLFKTLPTSYEIWPPVQWDKSNGLVQMTVLTELDLDKVLILYIGDSDADEPAFKWVNNQQGVTIRVGKNSQSFAQFKINSPKEVEDILKMLIARI